MAVSEMLSPSPKTYVEPDFYYDHHRTKEDLMGDSYRQSDLVIYLTNLLRYCYQLEEWTILPYINIYPPAAKYKTTPIEPDLAVFKGIIMDEAGRDKLRSWKMNLPNRPAPAVAFEIASDGTWTQDLGSKKRKYRDLGVKEYFAYDPNTPLYYPTRLLGWRYKNGKTLKIKPNSKGWLWSEELSSWLVPDRAFLLLYDKTGQQRLTEAEAERYAKEQEQFAKERERFAKEQERRAKEQERLAKEQERLAKEKAWAKLRELGIDPDTL